MRIHLRVCVYVCAGEAGRRDSRRISVNPNTIGECPLSVLLYLSKNLHVCTPVSQTCLVISMTTCHVECLPFDVIFKRLFHFVS